jgi:hypothetical protein
MAVSKKKSTNTVKKTAAKKSAVKKSAPAKKASSKKKSSKQSGLSAGFHPETEENMITTMQEAVANNDFERPDESIAVCEEKLRYANLMELGVQLAVVFLAGSLLLYMTGILPSATRPEQIPQYWNLRANEYLHATGSPKGWEWLGKLQFADNMIMLGVVGMAFLSMMGYFILANAYLRRKWYIFFSIVVTEILVILFASTGIISGGGH